MPSTSLDKIQYTGIFPAVKFNWFQLLVHFGSNLPLIWLIWDGINGNLTVNPIQALTQRTGKYALVFLLLCLSCSPLNSLFGFRSALKVRRALGLYAFSFALLHFMIFLVLDYGLNLVLIIEAIFEKRFAVLGFSAFIILTMLAITSTRGWKRRLGKKWKWLHRFIYPAVFLVIVHYMWAVKADVRIPLLYGIILLILLSVRIPRVRTFFKKGAQSAQKKFYEMKRSVLDVIPLSNIYGFWGRKIGIFIKMPRR